MREKESLLYHIALSMMPGLTPARLYRLRQEGISAREFLENPLSCADLPELMRRAREEVTFADRSHIRILVYGAEGYPRRLAETADAPEVLYMLGNTDLDLSMSLALVGTRRCTAYGAGLCRRLTDDLSKTGVHPMIISGLASGIDTAAHLGALEAGLPTVAVVAHGLDMIYPASNRPLAARIIENGGAIVTEYCSGTNPFKRNFLERNRIVAGLSDGVIIAESDLKGGAMSTARLALDYDREVMAFPGRAGDFESRGCNHLIRTHRASLIESATDVCEIMRWQMKRQRKNQTPDLFEEELTPDERKVTEFLRRWSTPANLDELQEGTGLSVRTLMALLPEMEFDGKISSRPGNRYTLSRS